MKKIKNNNLTSLADHIEQQYGTRGTREREKFEEGFEAFKLGVMIQELRKENGMTQEQLAEKCGTTKTYISRIENNASDIRLSTLMRIRPAVRSITKNSSTCWSTTLRRSTSN